MRLSGHSATESLSQCLAMIAVVITIMVAIMIVTPRPVILLFVGRQFLELAMWVTMSFSRPLVVVNHFIVIPHVIVRVIRIVSPIVVVVVSAGQSCERGS